MRPHTHTEKGEKRECRACVSRGNGRISVVWLEASFDCDHGCSCATATTEQGSVYQLSIISRMQAGNQFILKKMNDSYF